jgi:hypothetical protein
MLHRSHSGEKLSYLDQSCLMSAMEALSRYCAAAVGLFYRGGACGVLSVGVTDHPRRLLRPRNQTCSD